MKKLCFHFQDLFLLLAKAKEMAFATICSSHSKSSQISKSAGLGWLQGCGTDGKKRTLLTRKAKKKKKKAIIIILAPYYADKK